MTRKLRSKNTERLENCTWEQSREQGKLSDTGMPVWRSLSSELITMQDGCPSGGNAHRAGTQKQKQTEHDSGLGQHRSGYCSESPSKKLNARLGGLRLKLSPGRHRLNHCVTDPPLPPSLLCQTTGSPCASCHRARRSLKDRMNAKSERNGEEAETALITRVPWLSLRGLKNQYVKLAGCTRTHLPRAYKLPAAF